jgi:hypothetical protein
MEACSRNMLTLLCLTAPARLPCAATTLHNAGDAGGAASHLAAFRGLCMRAEGAELAAADPEVAEAAAALEAALAARAQRPAER